jgi:phosphoribosylamine--glycine ligase (EC 6.3.4.13)
MRRACGRGAPFVGALYAGLMLTEEGPKVLEYNARFGDPETQAILPLIRSDLLVLLEACARGAIRVTPLDLRVSSAAVCIVLASKGYPERPVTEKPIRIGVLPERAFCLHAGTKKPGTKKPGDELVSAGGRVLSVCRLGRFA